MLKVYRHVGTTVNNTERFFNQNIKRFDISTEKAQGLLWSISRTKYLGGGKISTPYGKGDLRELDIPSKLALCLLEFPSMVFTDWGCSDKAMEIILNLPEGNLLLTRTQPYSYHFKVRCAVDGKRVATSSTDLNIYMHLEDVNGSKEKL